MRCYYRFRAIGVDYTSERNVMEYSMPLKSFRDLSAGFAKLKAAFDAQSKERADIAVNIFPDIFGVTELSVYHSIKTKLFSKEIKKQCFLLCLTKYETPDRIIEGMTDDERTSVYEYETTDFDEVVEIFRDVIVEQVRLDLSKWKCAYTSK